MSIPADTVGRGCAANFPQPAAQYLVETVYHFNCRVANPPLADIKYRSGDGEEDTLRQVFRWDLTPHEEVFRNGFQARRQEDTSDEVYYNLDHYVHHGGRPLDSRRPATHAFLSTTLSNAWHPTVRKTVDEIFRYEIYAPGGILVAQTLADRYQYRGQDEVAFVAGIAPQYIRSVLPFKLQYDAPLTYCKRIGSTITANANFNPQSHPPRLLNIRMPVLDEYYKSEHYPISPLSLIFWPPEANHNRTDLMEWYACSVANYESYIDAAFRSSRENEAYVFMKNEYVVLNYAPGTKDNKVVYGPFLICDGLVSLTGTAFAEHGIDCAFGYHNTDEAFIFSGNLCARINFAPWNAKDDKITKGPVTITDMFPFLKETQFKSGVDAAFESTREFEAYLFKDTCYAVINYSSDNPHLISVRLITDDFHSLRNTIFETGIDAAFASHIKDQAYLFKGDSYACINVAPGTREDKTIVLPHWPSLQAILPRKNRGLDVHKHINIANDAKNRDEDEL